MSKNSTLSDSEETPPPTTGPTIVEGGLKSFPYSALVYIGLPEDYAYGLPFPNCTGALIGWNTVLTAAHCLYRGAHQYREPQTLSPIVPGRKLEENNTVPTAPFGNCDATRPALFRAAIELEWIVIPRFIIGSTTSEC